MQVRNSQGKGSGPVALLWKDVQQLGWQRQHPWKFTCQDGSYLDLLEGPEGQWKHVIRQALRDMVLQEKSWLNRKVVKICKVCGPLLLLTLRPPPGCCGALKKHSTPHTRVNLR